MWENLKAGIASVIRTNNNNEITGANLQSVLNNIVNTVGANATFAGMATPNTNPGSPDGPVFYFTQGPGLYVNFGNLQIDDNIVILANLTGVWQNLGPLVYESFTPADKSKLESIESGAEVNVQSDWNQTDDSEDDYIKNKPEVYTKTEIDQKLAGNVKREIVSELPQTGVDGTIYMVPSATAATGDVYDEYMWLSTQPDVQAHFEKIGTTKADLANYYTKSEVDTALGNKQASITITNNTSTPADNDTVIMQASGTTNTTTFLRRTMSKIWDYIKSKADSVYFGYGKTYYVNNNLINYNNKIVRFDSDNIFYAIQYRNNVQWTTRDALTDEILNTYTNVNNLFIGARNYGRNHPYNGVYDEILIGNGTNVVLDRRDSTLIITFNQLVTLQLPLSVVSIMAGATIDTAEWEDLNVSRVTFTTNRYYDTCILPSKNIWYIRIKNYGINSSTNLQGPSGIECYRNVTGLNYSEYGYSCVTKYPVKQDLYGEVEAPKFIMRGGTSQQVLLANGETINMPSAPGTNKDTLLKNLISGLSSGSDTVTDGTEIITSYAGPNGFNQSGVVNTAYKRQAIKFWNYIKGKADNVYTQKGDTYTVNMSADANHQGTNEYRVLATLATADCCILNITKTIYGYPAQNTVWFANQNSVSLISLSDFGFVAIGGRSGQSADLCVPVLPTGHPAVEYKIQIVRSTDSESVTFPSSATYKTYGRPQKANVVMRDEISTDAVTFNITSGTGSVSLEDSNDFIGNVTDASTAAGITVTNYEQGQCYRFTFTEELEGVTLYSSNSVALCTVNEPIQKGDVLTFTSVSNTAGGWMYSKTGASIKSSDGSVGIEWENGVADLSVEKVPFNNLVNKAMFEEGDSPRPLAVGEDTEAIAYTGNSSYPYAYSAYAKFTEFTVDGGSGVFFANVTNGTTYTIVCGNNTQTFTADGSSQMYVLDAGAANISEITTDVPWIFQTAKVNILQLQRIGSSKYIIVRASYTTAITSADFFVALYVKKANLYVNFAIGDKAKATGIEALAIGVNAKSTGGGGMAIGKNAAQTVNYSMAIGVEATASKSYATAIGRSAKATGYGTTALGDLAEASTEYSTALGASALAAVNQRATAIGNAAKAEGLNSTAIGCSAHAYYVSAISIGAYTNAKAQYAIAIGGNALANNALAICSNSHASGTSSIAIGDGAIAKAKSSDTDRPFYNVKRFRALAFTVNNSVYRFMRTTYGESVTVTVNGVSTTITAPSSNQACFIVVNDSAVPYLFRAFSPYARANNQDIYVGSLDAYDILNSPLENGSNYYAIWFGTQPNFMPIDSDILSFSLLAYYTDTLSSNEQQIAIGPYAESVRTKNLAIGERTKAISTHPQTVIGAYNIPDEDAYFIIGAGYSGNNRKNLLTIDSNELMHVRGVINAVRTIDTGGTMASVTQLKDGVLKVTGGGQLELSTTGAVEGLAVKVYASGSQLICNGNTINANCFKEYIFLDGDWRAQM